MVSPLRIGDRVIGGGAPCFIIAEAGVNHDGDLATALALVDAAAAAGADAVKFQTWQTDRLVRPGAPKAAYQDANSPADADQYTMLRRLEMPYDWHGPLKARAEAAGVGFLSTPDEIVSARFLCDLGVPALKIGSAELANLPYLRQIARLGKPILLSTGMGSLDEVQRALSAIRDAADVPVALLHCVSTYPAPEDQLNLRVLPALAAATGMPVGLSDHTLSALAPLVGVGLGMAVYERHLTLDRRRPGPDHAASTEPEAFADLVRQIRRAEAMLGDGIKRRMPCEEPTVAAVSRSLFYVRELPAGHRLADDDMVALRPAGLGLPPADADLALGRTLSRSVAAGDGLQPEDWA